MRKNFLVFVIAEGSTTRIQTHGVERIGTEGVIVGGLPEVELFLPGDTPSRELLKDALVHLVEHL